MSRKASGNVLNRGEPIVPLKIQHRRFLIFCQWGNHLFFVDRHTGLLMASGQNNFGQLCLGDRFDRFLPELVPYFEKLKILDVTTGAWHSLFVTSDEKTYSCGSNKCGQLANGRKGRRSLAGRVALPRYTQIVSVFCDSKRSSYFLTKFGEVFSAGKNDSGQLGLGDRVNRNRAERIRRLRNVIHIVTGQKWAIFMCRDNSLFATGRDWGQFGLGRKRSRRRPFRITFFSDRKIKVALVTGSVSTAYYLTEERDVYISGTNSHGQYGDGTKNRSYDPILSKGMSGFDVFGSGNARCFVVFMKGKKLYGAGLNSREGEGEGLVLKENSRFGLCDKYGKPVVESLTVEEISYPKRCNVVQVKTSNCNTFLICNDGTIITTGNWFKTMQGEKKGSIKFEKLKFKVKADKFKNMKVEKEERFELMINKSDNLLMINLNL